MNTISSLLSFIGSFEPIGSVKMYAGASTPSKWLYCDGSAVSRTTYAKLFAVIGTTYGAGNGSTTFNLPDFRGRVPVGMGKGTAADAQTRSLGYAGGTETVTLTVSQMPSHTHVQNSHNHTQNSHNHTQNSHNHTQNAHTHNIELNNTFHPTGGGSVTTAWAASTQGTQFSGVNVSTTATNIATTATNNATTATNQAATATNQNTGGGGAHGNMMPYLSVRYIIFAGK